MVRHPLASLFVFLLVLVTVGAEAAAAQGSITGRGSQALVWPEPSQNVTAVAAANDSIVAWGYNALGQCNVPEPNRGFLAVAGGQYHSLGLRVDGSIVAWGLNWYGECDVPEPNTGFVAVAAEGFISLGVKADGSIVAFGDPGQCDVPEPNSGFVAAAAGAIFCLGLKEDGSIVGWGDNTYGQCDAPPPNTGFVAVAAGQWHSLGLKADGSIVAWGPNDAGQCNVPEPNSGFVAIAGGAYHCLGLKADGSIVAWGYNGYGQCDVPPPNGGFVGVAAGNGFYGGHSLGLRADGSIVAWGMNVNGQCDVPAPNSGFVGVAAGGFHSLGLKAEQPTALEYSGLQAAQRARAVEVQWLSAMRRDFDVYRADGMGASYSKINDVPVYGWGELSYVDAAVHPNTPYWYRLGFIDVAGRRVMSDPVSVTTGVWEEGRVELVSVGPSPSRGDVVVRFSVPEREAVGVRVYDAAGRLIRVLGDGLQDTGDHTLTWWGRDEHGNRVASGVYFVRLTDGRATETRKVVLRR